MPDHIHIALKGNPKKSPMDIGLSFLNNLWYFLNVGAVWKREVYAGSFSEYSLKELEIRGRFRIRRSWKFLGHPRACPVGASVVGFFWKEVFFRLLSGYPVWKRQPLRTPKHSPPRHEAAGGAKIKRGERPLKGAWYEENRIVVQLVVLNVIYWGGYECYRR
jgi:hypothetical protein